VRIEFPGVDYDITSRGDSRELIYQDDADRLCQLDVLAAALPFALGVGACAALAGR